MYQALGKSLEERAAAYRQLCEASIDANDLAAIRAHLEQERALGSTRFQDAIEATLKRSVHLRRRRRKESSNAAGNVSLTPILLTLEYQADQMTELTG